MGSLQKLSAAEVKASAKIGGGLLGAIGELTFELPSGPPEELKNNLTMLNALVQVVQAKGMYLCLVFDEGHLAFPTPPDYASGAPVAHALAVDVARQLEATKALLTNLVTLTKQTGKVNVLIASSEYSYPYRLLHDKFFDTENLTRTIFAGEVPPSDMRDLLLHKWGLGPNLSDVFLAYYGGHVHMASQALALLATKLGAFDCMQAGPRVFGVRTCRKVSLGSIDTALREMAACGFASVGTIQDPAPKLIAQENVGGLVDTHATVVGLPTQVRGSAELGVVPTSHYIRHVIAKELFTFPTTSDPAT